MSQIQNITDVSELSWDQFARLDTSFPSPRSQGDLIVLAQCTQYLEEVRQNTVYEALKYDLSEYAQLETRAAYDYLGRRELSMSDLVEGTNILTSTFSATQTSRPANEHHISALWPPTDVSDDNHLTQQKASLSSSATARTSSSLLKDIICCTPTTASAPLTPTDAFLVAFERGASDEELDELMKPISPCNSIDHYLRIDNCGLPTGLDKFLAAQVNNESSSIRDVGHVNSTIIIQDDLSERAYASSLTAAISNMPTPELTSDNEVDNLDYIKLEEVVNESFPSPIGLYHPKSARMSVSEQDISACAQPAHVHDNLEYEMQAVGTEEQHVDRDDSENVFTLREEIPWPQEVEVATFTEFLDFPSPTVKQEDIDSDKENDPPSRYAIVADPAVHPDFDMPNGHNPTFFNTQLSLIKNGQAVDDLGEPRHSHRLTLGTPSDSSMIKRRTKRYTSGKIRASQKLLSTKTHSQAPEIDIASFFRRNSRFGSTSSKAPPPSIRISKRPTYGDSPRIKKRNARESFDLIELCHENTQRATSLKRSREKFDLVELCHENTLREQQSRKRPRLLVDIPTTPISACLPSTPSSIVSSSFDGSPMATALKGYPGQFEIDKPQSIRRSTKEQAIPTVHIFGNHLHANGEVINLTYTPDPFPTSQTLNVSDLPNHSTTIEHASLHHAYAEEIPRSIEEDALRKEAHRECAAARLEGVPVGYYRYFAGHMTVEEYVDARMCVCWKGCWCCRMCTRFGDLICPCVEGLVVSE